MFSSFYRKSHRHQRSEIRYITCAHQAFRFRSASTAGRIKISHRMITHLSDEFNLFLYIWLYPKLSQQIVITFFTHIPMMNFSILFREKIPRMMDGNRPLPENPLLYHHLFAAAIADYGLQLTAAFVLSHLILALPSCFQTGGALFLFISARSEFICLPKRNIACVIRQTCFMTYKNKMGHPLCRIPLHYKTK